MQSEYMNGSALCVFQLLHHMRLNGGIRALTSFVFCASAIHVNHLREALSLVPVNSRLPKWTGGWAQKNANTQGNAAPER